MTKPLRRMGPIALLVCSSVLAGFSQGQTQKGSAGVSEHAFQLADQKMEVSRLDWILLTARVRLMEQNIAHQSSRPASPVGMLYDRQKKRVVVNGFVDPDWIDRAKVDEVKKVLLQQSASYCMD